MLTASCGKNTKATMKILLLTQWFDPEPTFKGLVFARELVRQGFDVEVLTGFPNYPGGKLYPGYRLSWLKKEVIDGVKVTRVPLYPSHDQSSLRRIFNYISFALSAMTYGLFTLKKHDVIYSYHPPLTIGVAAVVIRFFRRVPVVYDIQDMWPDTLRATGMIRNQKVLNIIEYVCQWVYRHVDHLVVLSPGFKNLLIERGVPFGKIDVIYNWADEAKLGAPIGDLPVAFPDDEHFRIVFAGNMGKAQALQSVLEAAEILQTRNSRVCFILVGDGVDASKLKNYATLKQLKNVVFIPQMPMAEVGTLLQAADALLVHLRKDPLFKVTIPSKTQAYMATGKPLLMAVDGDAASLIHRSSGGIVAESENAVQLAEAAEALANHETCTLLQMGGAARRFYQEHLALAIGVARFGEIFRQVSKNVRQT